jgi:hypothetical protein
MGAQVNQKDLIMAASSMPCWSAASCLHHFFTDTPQALQDMWGLPVVTWHHFVDYAEIAVKALGDRAKH